MELLGDYLIVPYMVAVIAFGYAYKALVRPKLKEQVRWYLQTKYVILAIAAILWAAFSLYSPTAYTTTGYITTYALSIAFYDLILKWIESFFDTNKGGGWYGRARRATFRDNDRLRD